jgi:hypothetical protein
MGMRGQGYKEGRINAGDKNYCQVKTINVVRCLLAEWGWIEQVIKSCHAKSIPFTTEVIFVKGRKYDIIRMWVGVRYYILVWDIIFHFFFLV